jgi:hypothetical protein
VHSPALFVPYFRVGLAIALHIFEELGEIVHIVFLEDGSQLRIASGIEIDFVCFLNRSGVCIVAFFANSAIFVPATIIESLCHVDTLVPILILSKTWHT